MGRNAAGVGDVEHAPGDVLDGRYRLVRRLGRGGFGDVWQAEERLPGGGALRDVALKLLHTGPLDAAFWVEEAKLLASFRHPSLVTIYAAGLLPIGGDGARPTPFVAMELLEGASLGDLMKRRGRVPWRRALAWARDAAAALDVIHRRGVVHLDLKPANLFLTDDGTLKVLDFGISRRAGAPAVVRAPGDAARAAAAFADLPTADFVAANEAFAPTAPALGSTTERAIVGTPGFMAPEVFESAEPTAATDAYALAATLVLLATGRLPHEVPDEPRAWDDAASVSSWWAELRRATLAGSLRDLGADPARLPRGVIALAERLLAVDPSERRVRAGGLFAALDEVWQRPHGAPRPPFAGRASLGPTAEGLLFGRDDDVARLGRDLELDGAVVLEGPARSGKSSLAAAGLAPHLARRAADGKDDWAAVPIAPGGEPDAALERALAAIDPALAAASVDELARWCGASDVGLALIVDPLEDLANAPEGSKSRLEALIDELARRRRSGLRLVGCVREGAAPAIFASPALAPLRPARRFVSAPAPTAARDLVERPAALAGAPVGAIDDVVADVRRELMAGGERLVLVAAALEAFWARAVAEGGARELSAAPWAAMGGVRGAAIRHADRVVGAMVPERRLLAEEILLELATPEGAPLAVPEGELLESLGASEGDGARREPVLAVLRELEDADVVLRRGGRVTAAHEGLVGEWPRIVSARLAAMDRLAFRDALRSASLAWERAGEPRDRLWSGARLRELRRERSWLEPRLSPAEREFVRASRRAARRRRARDAAVAVGLVACAVAVVWLSRALEQRRLAAEASRRTAERQRYVAEVVARSRRSDDPFERVAWIDEAVAKGSTDAALALDLARAAAGLPRARFLTLDPGASASLPWNERFVVARTSASTLLLVDLEPLEPVVFEGALLDDDDAAAARREPPRPRATPLRPHDDAIAEVVPLAFDTAFATRSVTGEVRVFRIGEDGAPALAAVAPMTCSSSLLAAEEAPVLACAGEEGLARWDLRVHARDPARSVVRRSFQGVLIDVSVDGERVAAALGRRALVWSPRDDQATEIHAEEPVVLGRFSPRDRLIALVEPGRVEIAGLDRPDDVIFRADAEPAPASARWAPSGLDLAVCTADGLGAFHYLRPGARAASDPEPPASARPCEPPASPERPRVLASADEAGDLAGRDLGPRGVLGAFALPDGRVLARDLVLFESTEAVAARLLFFRGREPTGDLEPYAPTDSLSALVRDGKGWVAAQVGPEIRIYRASDGLRTFSRKGNILGRCDDGRLLAWGREGDAWDVFDARSGSVAAMVPRVPGFVLGVDAACQVLITQRLDGAIEATSIVPGTEPHAELVTQADGYVYDVRPSRGGDGVPRGLWLAASSGALARLEGGAARLYGYARPRATAIGDGPRPGDLAFADAGGVVIQSRGGEAKRALEGLGGVEITDLAIAADGGSLLLAASDRLRVLDLATGDIVGSLAEAGLTRLSPWDERGESVVAWVFDRVGGAYGRVIPRAPGLVRAIARSTSNLRVDDRRLVVEE